VWRWQSVSPSLSHRSPSVAGEASFIAIQSSCDIDEHWHAQWSRASVVRGLESSERLSRYLFRLREIPRAKQIAASSSCRSAGESAPTRSPSTCFGIVVRSSHEATDVWRRPSSWPTGTSVGISRMVRVIGATVTCVRTAIPSGRVTMTTGRMPAGGPRSAQ
jgi:hypothetical protein